MKLRALLGGITSSMMILGVAATAGPSEPAPKVQPKITLAVAPFVSDEPLPEHREPPPPPPPPPPAPKPKPKPTKPKPKPEPKPAANVDAYRGVGAWVDIFDLSSIDPEAATDEMAGRGVRTLYLETSNWKAPEDIMEPAKVGAFVDRARKHNMSVVAWYLPGFGDMDRDIRRSLAAINFKSPGGNGFSGFAPDIEARNELLAQVRAEHPEWADWQVNEEGRLRFNASIGHYSRTLRQVTPGGSIIGAIVPDAKNNERAPGRWEGFPWGEIAAHYDVIMPMAYWTADPGNAGCPGADVDIASYMKQVFDKTVSLMGASRPMHLIGGVARCISVAETAAYAGAMKAVGSLGASLYDFQTMTAHAERELLWAELARFAQ